MFHSGSALPLLVPLGMTGVHLPNPRSGRHNHNPDFIQGLTFVLILHPHDISIDETNLDVIRSVARYAGSTFDLFGTLTPV